MPAQKLKKFLENHEVKYVSIRHSPAFTAQEIAATAHVPGKELAKAVMIIMDGQMAMAVLPASHQVNLKLLKEVAGAGELRLATEEEFKDEFPDCVVGAMPPFGNLYGMVVYAAEALREDKEIAFNAGSHGELIKLAYEDFEKLVKPKMGNFSEKKR
jgi:Ala-tRNA(Pro) deacylase